MKATLLFALLSLFALCSFGCLLTGFYHADLIIIAAGALLATASALLYSEVKKIMANPFEKG